MTHKSQKAYFLWGPPFKKINKFNIKYNHAKRSIPAHPTFVNDTNPDLHLWTVTSKSIGFTMVNMPAKFDKEIHNGLVSIMFTSLFPYMSIVTLTFDLWPKKQQGPSSYHD